MSDKPQFDHLVQAEIGKKQIHSYQIVEESQIFNQSFGTLTTTI